MARIVEAEEEVSRVMNFQVDELENALFTADFFTKFYRHFDLSLSESDVLTAISPEDVYSAMQYRSDTNSCRNIRSIAKACGMISDSELQGILDQNYQEILWSKQQRVKGNRISTDEDVDKVIKLFELWSTKLIANKMLVNNQSSSHGNEKAIRSPCSTLLNLPGGNHINSILLKQNENEIGEGTESASLDNIWALPLPANTLTCKEFLRISNILATFGSKEEIYQASLSPLTFPSKSLITGNDLNKTDLYGIELKHEVSDLIALWVRAQRHSGAFRHLINLFTVKSSVTSQNLHGSENEKGVDGRNKEGENIVKYTAFYRGNHERIKTIADKEAPLVDRLMDWAIMNQVLFTRQYVSESIQSNSSDDGKRKRDLALNEERDSKKRKSNGNAKANGPLSAEMKHAREIYLIRWFARRHRNVLSALFSSHPAESGDSQSVITQNVSDMLLQKIPKKVKQLLKEEYDSSDRTFARIDRRISLGKYDELEGTSVSAVVFLLSAFKKSLPDGSLLVEDVGKAEEDFKNLTLQFVSDENESSDVKPLTLMSMNDCIPKSKIDGQIIECLEAHPEPWFDKCSVCKKEIHEFDPQTKVCWNCEESVHDYCLFDEVPNLTPPIPLANTRLLSLIYTSERQPSPLPDFIQTPINWTKLDVFLCRSHGPDGKLPRWGLDLNNTEHCRDNFDSIQSFLQGGLLDKALNLKSLEASPLRLPYDGILVSGITAGCVASTSSLQESDIIIEIEDTGNRKVLAEVNRLERCELFRGEKEKIKLTIMRPSQHILEISKEFVRSIEAMRNQANFTHVSLMENRWYCKNCRSKPGLHTNNDHNIKEAKSCRAVLRRLGMEWSSLPFHNEGEGDLSLSDVEKSLPDHLEHVSLRRLDGMLGAIISLDTERQDSDSMLESNMQSHVNAFTVPPWAKDAGLRLKWADKSLEARPFDLLCKGVALIIKRAKLFDNKIYENHLQDFKVRFVKLAVSWCLDFGNHLTKGPSLSALLAIEPWLSTSCRACSVRPRDKNPSSLTCGKIKCIQKEANVNSRLNKSCKNNIPDGKEFQTDAIRYDFLSSYIGSSFVILPGDPLLISLSKTLQFTLDDCGRCCEFIVISYIPPNFIPEDQKHRKDMVREEYKSHSDKSSLDDGIYYILPVLSETQLKYVLERCEMRKFNKRSYNNAWLLINVLNLSGIIGMTPTELQRRISASNEILGAIERAVSSLSQCETIGRQRFDNEEQKEWSSFPFSDKGNDGSLDEILKSFEMCNKGDILTSPQQCMSWLSQTITILESFDVTHTCLSNVYVENEELETDIEDNDEFSHSPNRNDDVNINACSTNSTYDLTFLQKMMILESDAVKRRLCKTRYTDLIYWDKPGLNKKGLINEWKNLESVLSNQIFKKPTIADLDNTDIHMVVLHRLTSDYERDEGEEDDQEWSPCNDASTPPKYIGKGWGFELVEWDGDNKNLRVGRIAPDSPAARAGLENHDVLMSINGLGLSVLKADDNLAKLLLGFSIEISMDLSPEHYPSARLLYDLKKATLGPVSLEVRRMDSNEVQRKPSKSTLGSSHLIPSPFRNGRDGVRSQVSNANQQSRNVSKVSAKQQSRTVSNSISPTIAKHAPQRNSVQSPLVTHQEPHQEHFNDTSYQNAFRAYPQGHLRKILQQTDLYMTGVSGSFLSLAETCVLLEAIRRNSPYLGQRLLTPRYLPSRVQAEYKNVLLPFVNNSGWQFIPMVSDDQWQLIISLDYRRSKTELDPIVCQENGFSYREAISRLPIDRYLEDFFKQNRNSPESQHQYEHQGYVPFDVNNYTRTDGPVYRIRGGGGNGPHLPRGMLLSQISLDLWYGVPVSGSCFTTDSSGAKKEDTFVGKVMSHSGDGIASVNVFYVKNAGRLQQVYPCESASTELYLVPGTDKNSNEDQIVSIFEQEESVDLKRTNISTNRTRATESPFTINELSIAFVNRWKERMSGSSIGYLPDGRTIHWFFFDPCAVYIQNRTADNAHLSQIVQQEFRSEMDEHRHQIKESGRYYQECKPDSHVCFWGCSEPSRENGSKRKLLSFETENDLKEHLSKHHFSYPKDGEEKPSQWIRVEEGSQILEFAADLTSLLCARCLRMGHFAQSLKNGESNTQSFTKSPFSKRVILNISKLMNFEDGKPNYSLLRTKMMAKKKVRQIIRLYSRIACLFSLEDSGVFRQKKALNLHMNPNTESDEIEHNLLQCIHESIKKPNEEDLKIDQNNVDGSDGPSIANEEDTNFIHSVEEHCTLLCNLLLKVTPSADKELLLVAAKELHPIQGELDQIKELLFRIAANVPSELYLNTSSLQKVTMADTLLNHEIWKESYLNSWREFVLRCMNSQMVMQAFILLICSLNKKKMPTWWKTKHSGWSSSCVLMKNPSLSMLAVHLHVLDVALAEYYLTKRSQGTFTPRSNSDTDNAGVAEMKSMKTRINGKTAEDNTKLLAKKKRDDLVTKRDSKKSKAKHVQKFKTLPKELRDLILPEQMKIVMEWAASLGIPRHDDESDECCYLCNDGGELICCEFCANVVHQDCTGYKGNLDDVEDWVCIECIHDINDIRNQGLT